ncbi:hypothetical protein ACIPLC_22605 [Kitasatospora sp. NPDC086801]|uniref:hypothetical protein n=1 Tax=Kitasatospora sp. NPDC086801 TaxID=3364066 RepID=UPI0037F12C99
MTIRRTAALSVTAAALTLTSVAGCGEKDARSTPAASAPAVGASADATGAFDPAAAIAHRDPAPYAASLKLTTEAGEGDEQVRIVVTGRGNLNTPTRGNHTDGETTAGGFLTLNRVESLTVDGTSYMRDKQKPEAGWKKVPSSTDSDEDANHYTDYAKVLLAAGPAARKGMEVESGVPVFHLGAKLSVEQVRRADPSNASRMESEGVDTLDYQLWIDRFGRAVRGEQSMTVRGKLTVVKGAYSDFGPPETFVAPLVSG